MAKDIKIPQIAEGVETATVNEILVAEGDTIEKDQSLITVESDKASVDIPSPQAGTVKSIKVSEGDEVNVGDVIISLEEADGEEEDEESEDTSEENKKEDEEEAEEDTDSKEKDEKSEEKKKKKSAKKDKEDEEDKASSKDDEDDEDEAEEGKDDDEDEERDKDKKKAKKEQKESESDDAEEKEESEDSEEDENDEEIDAPASPGVRRFARELGVNLSKVKGSGAKGRISKEDVKKHNKQEQAGGSGPGSVSLPDFSKWGETETKALSGIRSATAKNVANAWSAIPHVFQFDESDITEIEEYMEKNKEKAEKAGGHLTITAILVKIAATALRQFPKFNGSIDMENKEMILKKYVHIGVAVDTEKGLLVPVIRNADQKTIIDISKEITELAEKARDGKLSGDEMKGGSFTISNLGGLGGTNFTPLVNYPQVAILGVSRAKKHPVYIEDNLEPRDILPLSLSYDHRMIDGAEGVRFLNWISRALEDPYKALLGV
ncbi:pyruvate dehydrogenase E2 component (dihydrolipoamide acetyltransferase) [Salegentibacter echinorum]|uniref:Dihydrolipoamide acetyltransferase component of pyruvate dehydrogenase complex n=1 Tax=Salegentibacter echinorum TaxID=1073325 RepID=A0A1M5LHM1_SALEC|nr:2-oxo acid dehydrogenase subunit E2 [Salegentibacter echinorum]SHG64179.1 pyruvate dehydrogenase E2 component (dihydrolipoamide acetyltransferase) [Salegentibacter echinorum]